MKTRRRSRRRVFCKKIEHLVPRMNISRGLESGEEFAASGGVEQGVGVNMGKKRAKALEHGGSRAAVEGGLQLVHAGVEIAAGERGCGDVKAVVGEGFFLTGVEGEGFRS